MRSIRYPVIEQTSLNDCGASCLYMILKYYGGFETLDNLKKRTNTKKEGTTLFDLKEAAISLGFHATCYYLENKELNEKIQTPFIAHVLIDNIYYHYIVVYKISKKKILVADPAKGILEDWKMDKFKHVFEGNIMTLYPSRPLYRNSSYLTLKKAWKIFLKKDKKLLTQIITSSIVTIFMELICTTSFYLLLKFIKYNNIHLLFGVTFLFAGFVIGKNIITYFRNKFFCYFEVKFERILKEKRWRNILNLPYHDLILKETGEITLSLEQVGEITQFYLKSLLFFTLDIPMFLILFILLISIQKQSIFLLILLVIQLISSYFLVKRQKKQIKKYQYDVSKIKKIEEEIKESLISLKNTNLLKLTQERLSNQYKIHEKEEKSFSKKMLFINIIQNMVNEISALLINLFILILLFYGEQTLETCILLFQLFSLLNSTIGNFLEIFVEKEKIKIYLESYLEEKENKKQTEEVKTIQMQNGKHHKFSHLKNISFFLKRGDKLLLFGKSGIGKSTLMNIIKRNYPNDSLFINGNLNMCIEEKVCYVTSKPFVYTDTLKNNIDYGRKNDDIVIEELMHLLHINTKKDNTLENINYLSSGEKQKISLARSLLGEFDVLILDECLNQIDEIEEIEIMKNILEKYKDKIIIVISHRTNLKNLFNKIAVLTNHGQLKFLKRKEKLCLEDSLETYLKH